MTAAGERAARGTKLVIAVLLLCVAVRLIAWSNAVMLEDHDSTGYLTEAAAFASMDTERINALSPDCAAGFPLLTAAVSSVGVPLLAAARLVSLLFAVLMCAAVLRIGGSLDGSSGFALAVSGLLIALNPTLIDLGFAVLSEPAFIGLVYGALWLFMRRRDDSRPRDGLLIGLVLGLAFATRTEGVIFLGGFPLMYAIDRLLVDRSRPTLGRIAGWSAAFVVGFLMIAGPQVAWVSSRMGTPALNGRAVWMAIANQPGDAPYEQRIYGLDFDERLTNLEYLHARPNAVRELTSSGSVQNHVGIVARNVDELSRKRLGEMLGPVVIGLLGLGVIRLIRHGGIRTLAVFTVFIGCTLVGPLLYNVVPRHVAIVVPLALLGAGFGAARLRESFDSVMGRYATIGAWAVVIAALVTLALPLYRSTIALPQQGDYDPTTLQAVVDIVRNDAAVAGLERPKICSRTRYVPWFAVGDRVPLPFTDSAGLARYLALRDVDYLYLDSSLTAPFPFAREFGPLAPDGAALDGLTLLDRRSASTGGTVELYRVAR